MSNNSVSFLASFPPIQSAIKLDGRDGARIQLDIPENEMGNFIKIMMWKGEVFRVTIERIKQEALTELDDEIKKEPKRKSVGMDKRRFANG
jgi:hypothetical protein